MTILKSKRPSKASSTEAERDDAIEKLIARIQELETFKRDVVLTTTLLMALGVSGVVWSLVSGYWTNLTTKLEASANGSAAASLVIERECKRVVAQLQKRLFVTLDNVSRASRDRELELEIRETQAEIADFEQLSPFLSEDTKATLASIKSVYEIADDYADSLRPDKDGWTNSDIALLQETVDKWMALDVEAMRKGSPELAKTFEPHKENAIGVMLLQLEDEDPGRVRPPDYTKAKEHFKKAIAKQMRSPKAHSNLGMISAFEWRDSARKDCVLLDQAVASYKKAVDYATSPKVLSSAYNNLSATYLRRADWHLAKGETAAAAEWIAEAKSSAQRALAQYEPRPVANVSLAEAECVELRGLLSTTTTDIIKREIAERALARTLLAIDAGYTAFAGKNVSDLAKRWPFLDACSPTLPAFMQTVAKAATR